MELEMIRGRTMRVERSASEAREEKRRLSVLAACGPRRQDGSLTRALLGGGTGAGREVFGRNSLRAVEHTVATGAPLLLSRLFTRVSVRTSRSRCPYTVERTGRGLPDDSTLETIPQHFLTIPCSLVRLLVGLSLHSKHEHAH